MPHLWQQFQKFGNLDFAQILACEPQVLPIQMFKVKLQRSFCFERTIAKSRKSLPPKYGSRMIFYQNDARYLFTFIFIT